MRQWATAWILGVGGMLALAAAAGGAPLVELQLADTRLQGTPVAHNDSVCWLAGRDGRHERVDLSQVTSFRKLPGEFRSYSVMDAAAALRKELGPKYEVQVTGSILVAAARGQSAEYVTLMDTVQRTFSGYFSRRGLTLQPYPFPMAMIVFPTRAEFDEQCRREGIPVSGLLRGFYSPQSNRVLLYHDNSPVPASEGATSPLTASQGTAIHEAIHQLAFNAGLHSRVGRNPRWVVEGLATMLDGGGLQANLTGDASERANVNRLNWFRQHCAKGDVSLADFVAADEPRFVASPLDAYSQAWALTFFLCETRRADYSKYLKRIAARDPLADEYSPAERLADFQACFGKDLRSLEVQFLRFIDSLDVPASRVTAR